MLPCMHVLVTKYILCSCKTVHGSQLPKNVKKNNVHAIMLT